MQMQNIRIFVLNLSLYVIMKYVIYRMIWYRYA